MAVRSCIFQDFSDNQAGAITTHLSDHILLLNNRFINIGAPALGGQGLPDSQHALYLSDGTRHLVADGNYMEKISGFGVHGWGGYSGVSSYNWIVRNNTIVNTYSSSTIAAGTDYTNTYIYNNTLYNEQIPFPEIASTSANAMVNFHNGGSYTNTHIKNNISYGYAARGAMWSDNYAQFNGSLFLDYNLWNNLAGSTRIYFWQGTSYSFGALQATAGYDLHSIGGNPLFVDAARRNFNLQSGSPTIDVGTFLTTTVSAGSGTSLTVADAGFFMDGFGLLAGDMIQVGSNSPVQITAVNYETNTITVAQSISWSNGQGVSLPYSGARPDMGAHEYTNGKPTLPPPMNLRVKPRRATPSARLDTGASRAGLSPRP
jgi:hypothetical protein